MKTAIILHGTHGSSEDNWFQWLKDQLEAKGSQVWLAITPCGTNVLEKRNGSWQTMHEHLSR